MKADPLYSEGARVEREAIRAYLRRQIKSYDQWPDDDDAIAQHSALSLVLNWVLARKKRYDKRPGGLGK